MNISLRIFFFLFLVVLILKPISGFTANSAEAIKKDADLCYKEKEYYSALELYNSSFQLAKQIKDKDLISKILFKIGKSYQQINQYPEALDFYFQYLDSPKELITELKRSNILENIAAIYQDIGNYELSYDFQLQALEKRESINDEDGTARSFYQLGSLLFYQKNFLESMNYYKKAKEIWDRLNDTKSILYCIGSLGAVYLELGENSLALDYNLRSLEMAKDLEMKQGIAYAMHNVGCNYMELSYLEEAETYFLKSLEIKSNINDKWGQIGSYLYLGQLELKRNNYKKAVQYLEKGRSLSIEIGSGTREVELLRVLADAYHHAGNFEQSYEAFSSYADKRETLMNEKIAEEIGMRKAQYEVQKKEQEVAVLKKEERIKSLLLEIVLIGGSAIILLILSISLFYFYKTQKSHSQTLATKNNEIKQQYKELELANEELRKFAYVASHDLKAPLRTLGSFAGLLKRRYEEKLEKEGREFVKYIIDGAKRMDQLLSDLLTYCQIESKVERVKEVEAKNVVHRAVSNLQCYIGEAGGKVEVNEAALPKIKGNPNHLTRLFQNIIGNGIKFCKKDHPHIQVDCVPKEEEYVFTVKDNGIGIEPEFQNKIFGMFSRLHNIGEYEGTGIGLATCKKIIEKHSGRIWVESQPGEGSVFYFSLPR